jgi:hypothetical protein
MKKIFYSGVLSFLCCTTVVHGVVIIQGNSETAPYGFTVPITATLYDQTSGSFFVGLTTGGAEYALSRANRPFYTSPQSFIPIAGEDTIITNIGIDFLALSAPTQAPTTIVLVPAGAEAFSGISLVGTNETGFLVSAAAPLNDSTGAAATPGIVALTATNTYALAAVRGSSAGMPQAFGVGDSTSGIALALITQATNGITITPLNAETGQPVDAEGGAALLFNSQSEVLRTAGSSNVSFSTIAEDVNQLALFWDSSLAQAYIGVRILTGTASTDIGKGVAIATFSEPDQEGGLELVPIVADDVLATMDANTDYVLFAQGATQPITIKSVAVMHTTTGLSYLIVNGNAFPTDQVNEDFFAFPLIDNSGEPGDGTLANVNAPLIDGVFQTPPETANDLFNSESIEALVGAGNFPLQDPSDIINQMSVVGDTVYVAPGGTTDAGVFFSQALFGSDGKIARWTPWALRATPQNAFEQTTASLATVGFFAVDTTTGNLFMVDGEMDMFVGVSSWIGLQVIQELNPNTGAIEQVYSPDLVTQVSKVLVNGCYCMLDLDGATRGLQETASRYALFGGSDIIVFTLISTANETGPDTVTANFNNAENFLTTSLPTAGPLFTLEYSRQPSQNIDDEALGNINFFFAAAQNGLFVFASADGSGFDANQLELLNAPPFASGSWQQISSDILPGTPIDIQCNGNNLYILMVQPQEDQTVSYSLYNLGIIGNDTIAELFAPDNLDIIAQTGVGVFEDVSTFFGMRIVATGQEATITTDQTQFQREQIVLATNQGLFVSQANQDPAADPDAILGITTAGDQDAADWQLVVTPTPVAYSAVSGIETPVQHTVWPASIDDANNFKTFDRSSIHQISGSGDETGTDSAFSPFLPEPFNSNNPAITTLDPIINFWTDGARRFFTLDQFSTPYFETQLAVFPYNTIAAGVTTIAPLTNPTFNSVNRFFWAQAVGASGLVCAGTDSGIVALG